MNARSELIDIFTRERYALQGYIVAIVRDYQIAEDIYQDVAVTVLENLEKFDPGGNFRGWIRGIARNKAKQALSKRCRVDLVPNENLETLVDAAYEEQDKDTWTVLSKYQAYLSGCMGRLSKTVQRQFLLRYVDDESLEAISQKTGRSAGAVQVSLSRARQFLHSCVEKRARFGMLTESEP